MRQQKEKAIPIFKWKSAQNLKKKKETNSKKRTNGKRKKLWREKKLCPRVIRMWAILYFLLVTKYFFAWYKTQNLRRKLSFFARMDDRRRRNSRLWCTTRAILLDGYDRRRADSGAHTQKIHIYHSVWLAFLFSVSWLISLLTLIQWLTVRSEAELFMIYDYTIIIIFIIQKSVLPRALYICFAI